MSAPPALPGVFAALAPVLDSYGYLAVGGLLFLEDFGVPAPGETVLIAAAVYAGAGRLNLAVVVLVGLFAAIAGDNLGYVIGRYGGRRVVNRLGRYVGLTPTRLETAERFFDRHGGKIIVVARFVEGLRQANGIIAGLSGMPWRRFLSFNALGALLWVGVWTSLGYLGGAHIDQIYQAVSRYELYLLAALAVVVLALVIRWVRRYRGARGGPDTPDQQAGPSPDNVDHSAATSAHDAPPATPAPRTSAPDATTNTGDAAARAAAAAVPPRPGRTATVTGLAAVGVAAAGLVLLWVGVATGSLLAAQDPTVEGWLVAVRPPWLVSTARIASTVGQPAVMIALLVLVTALVAWRTRSWTPIGLSVAGLVLLAAFDNGVKTVVARPRPPLAWHAMPAHGLSFPSGHALWSAGTALLIVVLLDTGRARAAVGAAALVVTVVISGSRLVVAAHYPSDVLAGWCLAVLAVGIVVLIVTRLTAARPLGEQARGTGQASSRAGSEKTQVRRHTHSRTGLALPVLALGGTQHPARRNRGQHGVWQHGT